MSSRRSVAQLRKTPKEVDTSVASIAELVGKKRDREAAARWWADHNAAVGGTGPPAQGGSRQPAARPCEKDTAAVLFACERSGMWVEGLRIVRAFAERSGHSVGSSGDERIALMELRLLCLSGNESAAVAALTKLTAEGKAKARMFTPLLELCGQHGNLRLAEAVWSAAKSEFGTELRERELLVMLRLIVRHGGRGGAPPLESWRRVCRVLEDVADGVPTLSKKAANELLQIMFAASQPAGVAMPIALNECSVDALTGRCDECGALLERSAFLPEMKARLLRDVDLMFEARRNATPDCRPALLRFIKAAAPPLDAARQPSRVQSAQRPAATAVVKFNALIDGANVGYYGAGSSWTPSRPIDYALVERCRQQLRQLGYTPLILLHERHLRNAPTGVAQSILMRWRQEGGVFGTPSGFNDDVAWLYAALHMSRVDDAADVAAETDARNYSSSATAAKPTAPNSSRPCIFVSNDEMRDHNFTLLHPRSFARWRDRHRVTFRCGRGLDGALSDGTAAAAAAVGLPTFTFTFPPPFSRCMQRRASSSRPPMTTTEDPAPPLPVSDGGGRFDRWHIPVDDDGDDGNATDHPAGTTGTNTGTTAGRGFWICLSYPLP